MPIRSIQTQLILWVPKYFLKILNLIVQNTYAFGFEQFLHSPVTGKMCLTCEKTKAVYNPVSRNRRLDVMTGIHSPANHSCRTGSAEIACNGSITGNPANWNQSDNLINHVKKIRWRFLHPANLPGTNFVV